MIDRDEKWMVTRVRWVIPVLLGILSALSDSIVKTNGAIDVHDNVLYVRLLLAVLLFLGVFAVVDRLFRSAPLFLSASRPTSDEGHVGVTVRRIAASLRVFLFTPRSFCMLWAFVFVCWLPYVTSLNPGVYWSDTSQQLIEYYGGIPMTDHHPYLTTLIIGWFSDLGKALFRSTSGGLYLLIWLQVASATAVFAALIIEVRESGVGKAICAALLGFVAICPFFPVMFSSLVKDTLSAVLFLAFCLQFFKAIRTRGASLRSVKTVVLITVFAVLCSLTKKTMGYVVIPSMLLLLILVGKSIAWRNMLVASIAAVIIVFAVVPKLLLPLAGVAPGGKQEMIATLIQQVAHDVIHDDGSMSDEDKQLINDFLIHDTNQIPSLYDFEIVDPIKGRSVKDDSLFAPFVGLWARKTIQNPFGHFEAWLGLVHGWFGFYNKDGSPNYMVVCTESLWFDKGIDNYVDWPGEPDDSSIAVRTIYDWYQGLPVLSALFFRSTWGSIVPSVLVFIALRNRKGAMSRLILAAPFVLIALTLMITPVSGMGGEPTRYLFPLVCSAPFVMALLGVSSHGSIPRHAKPIRVTE